MRIVQINRHNLFLSLVLELVSSKILLSPLGIKPVLRVVLAGCWLSRFSFLSQFIDDAALCLTREHITTSSIIFLNMLWVVLTDTRHFLFEVNVDSYWLHIVQWVVLVERQ
jgi:hypothetical protein